MAKNLLAGSTGGGRNLLAAGGGASPNPSATSQFDPNAGIVQGIVRLVNSNNGVEQAAGKEALRKYGPDIPQDVLTKYGLKVPGGESLYEKMKRSGLGGASRVIDLLGRPGQAVLQAGRGGAEGRSGGVLGALSGVGKGLVSGIEGKNPITFEESVLGRGAHVGGVAGAVTNFVGGVVTDPTTYVTTGVKPLAKVGLRTLVKEGSADVAKSISQQGVKATIKGGLTDETAIRSTLRAAAERNGAPNAAKIADRQFAALERSGAGGIRFMGKTLPGTEGRALLGGGRIGRGAQEVGATREALQRVFRPRADVQRAFGPDVANELGQAISAGKGLAERGTSEASRSLLPSLRGANPEDLKAAGEYLLNPAKVTSDAMSPAAQQVAAGLRELETQTRQVAQRINSPLPPLAEALKAAPEGESAATTVFRRAEKVQKMAGFHETISRLPEIVDDTGSKLFHTDQEAARLSKVAREGLSRVEAGGRSVWAPKVIADDVKQVADMFVSDEGIRAAQKFTNKANLLWRAYATVLPTGLGFFNRNELGNIMSLWYGGVRNPGRFKEALDISRTLKSGSIEALSPAQRRIYETAVSGNVLDSGFFLREVSGAEQETARALEKGAPTGLRRGLHAVNPANPENVALSAGRKLNTALENNARLALYIDALDKTGDANQAAMTVKKYLFDYTDLTPAERKLIKPWVAFYTFARKNLPLQLETLARTPGKITGQVHAVEAGQAGGTPLSGPLPSGPVGAGGALIGRHIIGADLPVLSAMSQVQPLLELAKGRGADPKTIAAGILEPVAGVRGTTAKALAEVVTGTKMFNGQKLDTLGERQQDVVEALFPAISKGRRLKRQLVSLKKGDRAQLLNLALGLTVSDASDRAQYVESLRRLDEVDQLVKNSTHRDSDGNVTGRLPTLEELRKVGAVPKLATAKNPGTSSSSRLRKNLLAP